MPSGRDEIEQGMYPVVAEAWVTLDSRLLGQNVVVLAFEVVHDFLEADNKFIGAERLCAKQELTSARCQYYLQIQACPQR